MSWGYWCIGKTVIVQILTYAAQQMCTLVRYVVPIKQCF